MPHSRSPWGNRNETVENGCVAMLHMGIANAPFASILTLGFRLKGAGTKKLSQTKIKPVHDSLDMYLFDCLTKNIASVGKE